MAKNPENKPDHMTSVNCKMCQEIETDSQRSCAVFDGTYAVDKQMCVCVLDTTEKPTINVASPKFT